VFLNGSGIALLGCSQRLGYGVFWIEFGQAFWCV